MPPQLLPALTFIGSAPATNALPYIFVTVPRSVKFIALNSLTGDIWTTTSPPP